MVINEQERGTVLAGTGHRPQHLTGNPSLIETRMFDLARAALRKYKPDTVISGMAIGYDMALAKAAVTLKIPLIAAIPFVGQESRWNPKQKDTYSSLLKRAIEKIIVTKERPIEMFAIANAMQTRNKFMVDNCSVLLALYNTEKSSGGTANCIRYAEKVDRKIINLWSSWVKFSGV